MEYKMFNFIRKQYVIPYQIRVVLGFFLIILSIPSFILPIFPGLFFLILGIILIIPGKKVKHLVKLRKGIIYLFKNIHDTFIIRQKMYDIASHVKEILNNKK